VEKTEKFRAALQKKDCSAAQLLELSRLGTKCGDFAIL